MLCTADGSRRLQYVVYSGCVQKAAICCVQQMCSEVCNPLCSAHVLRSLRSAMFSRCVQKTAIRCILKSHLDGSFAHLRRFIVANFMHRGAPHQSTVTLVWLCSVLYKGPTVCAGQSQAPGYPVMG